MSETVSSWQSGRDRHNAAILVEEEHCRGRSISLSDNLKRFSMADVMSAHRPESVLETQFVFRLVVLADIAPITTEMARPVTLLLPNRTALHCTSMRSCGKLGA